MKYSFTILLSILLSLTAGAQTQTPVYLSQTITNASSKGYYQYLPADYNSTTKSYPVIIWIHGAGQLGQGTSADLYKVLEWGLPKIISEGGFPSSFTVNSTEHSFIVISPQFMGWPSGQNVAAMINYVSNNFRVDAERIYLMGISAGGGAVWDYASISVANSDRVAAMIPFCGTMAPTQALAGRIAASKMPVWAFHNTNDGTVPVANSRNWVSYINTYVPAPTPAAKLTEFPVQSSNAVIAHECWSLATLPTYKPQGINIYEWLLQYKRRTTIVNAAPVARAGNDTSVVLPATVNLNGYASTDADGIVAAYRWRKVSGPATHSFSDSTAANTVVSNLAPGTYQFELRVTDNGGTTATDNITVNVYAAFTPGTMQRVLIDVGSGSTTTTSNGLFWNNINDARAGVRLSNAITTLNLPSGINVQVVNRLDGTYSTSSNGMATGNTTGAVGDYPASATTDLALIHSSATNGIWRIYGMDAAKVYTIKFWGSRTNTSANRTAEIKRADESTWKSYTATNNTNFNNGAVFIISGKTTMDFNIRTMSGSDFSALGVIDISFGVEAGAPPANNPPVANAGANISIQLPVDSVLLNGCASTDPENAPLKFKWRKIAGPATFQLVNDTLCQPRVRSLATGIYQFELAVTDSGNLVSKDTVNLTVLKNELPVAVAGNDVVADGPSASVQLNGNGSYDPEGASLGYSWAIVSGNGGSFNNSQVINPVFNTSASGQYSIVLTVTDNTQQTDTDTLLITVTPPNMLPSANAGADRIHNLPPNSLQLNGSGTDADGSIVSYKWRKYSGPALNFSNDAIANPTISNLVSGTYLLELTVTDNRGGIGKDTIQVIVNAPPVANAGTDIDITGASANIQLNGSASTDPEAAALSYEWRIITGTSATLSNETSANPGFTSNSQGNFSVELKVTDPHGSFDLDTVNIIIAAANILPVANAGDNKLVNLPTNNLQLNGGGTDTDGTIVSYKWRKYSGPSLTFNNDAIANPVISNLVSGIYLLELTVTDNRNESGKDTIQVIVNAAPLANAGTDINISGTSANIQLNGSASSDPEGGSLAYAWRIIAGNGATLNNETTVNPGFISSAEGSFSIELKVTDSYGSSDLDTVNVVIAAANILPVANAGEDKLIHLPTNSTALNGSSSYDPDGTIVTYKWRKITGPVMSFSNDAIANPTVNSLTYGVYNFELVVTDNRGGIAKDSVLLTVNNPPVANAGTNASITLPANTVTLNGAASSDIDGSISAYNWRLVSGGSANINAASSVQTLVSFTSAGTYRFELTVTDNRGIAAKDSVDITVLPVPSVTAKTFRVNIFGGTNPYNNAQWNNWNVVSSLTSAKFNYDDGTASNVNANITAYGLIADNGANYAASATACPPAVLRYTSANTSYRILTFNGMSTTKTYNLEFYGSRANTGNGSTYQIGNIYDTISTDNNLNDVARFTNITPDNNGRISVIINRIGTWNYISGFVVTENTAASFAGRPGAETESVSTREAEEKELVSPVLTVHPNPVNNIINLTIPADVSGAYRISIMDMKGNLLLQRSGNKSTNGYIERIDASSLPKGMFLLKLTGNGINKSSTIIKL